MAEDRAFPHVPFPENGIIRVYNQFPRRYRHNGNKCIFQQMIEDLPRIAAMGFNAVWINPIQLTGNKPAKNKKRGSLYATGSITKFNPAFFKGVEENNQAELIIEFSMEARRLGLIPMFDLVLNHVGIETELEQYCMDQGCAFKGPIKRWPDINQFDYSDETKREKIFEVVWKPFIEKYIIQYGFGGVRVDAITNINPEIQKKVYDYIKACCQHHQTSPIILGELMAQKYWEHINPLKHVGFSHIFVSGSIYRNFIFEPTLREDWLLIQAKELQKIIWDINAEDKIEVAIQNPKISGIGGIGGSAGFVGNHDVSTLKGMIIFQKEGIFYKKPQESFCWKVEFDGKTYEWEPEIQKSPEDQARGTLKTDNQNYFDKFKDDYLSHMKEKILRIAIACNGGWYLLAGDEYGLPHVPKLFNDYQESKPLPQTIHGWEIKDDLTHYVQAINLILSQLPKTFLGDNVTYHRIKNIGPIVVRYSGNKQENTVVVCSLNQSVDELKAITEALKHQLSPEQKNIVVYIITNDNKTFSHNFRENEFKEMASSFPPAPKPSTSNSSAASAAANLNISISQLHPNTKYVPRQRVTTTTSTAQTSQHRPLTAGAKKQQQQPTTSRYIPKQQVTTSTNAAQASQSSTPIAGAKKQQQQPTTPRYIPKQQVTTSTSTAQASQSSTPITGAKKQQQQSTTLNYGSKQVASDIASTKSSSTSVQPPSASSTLSNTSNNAPPQTSVSSNAHAFFYHQTLLPQTRTPNQSANPQIDDSTTKQDQGSTPTNPSTPKNSGSGQ